MTDFKTTSDAIGRQREQIDSTRPGQKVPSPASGNTGEQSSQEGQKANENDPSRLLCGTPVQPETGGIDTLEVSLCVHWDPETWDGMVVELDEAKAKAAEYVEAGADEDKATVGWETPEGDYCGVGPTGVGGGFRARWMVKWQDVWILVSGRKSFKPGRPNVRIICGSMPLMQMGGRQCVENVLGVIKGMGGEVIDSVISRVDVCADLVGLSVERLFRLLHRGAFITDAKKWKLYGEGRNFKSPESVYLGEVIQCRIYDKEKETRNKPDKRELLIQRRWGCEPETATRVEFQIRREELQEKHGIHTLDDLWSKLPTLCEWFTGQWLRIVNDAVTHKNHQRAVDAAVWEQVGEAMQAWAGQPLQAYVRPVKRFRAQGKQLVAMMRGVMSTHMARFGAETAEAVEYALELLREEAGDIQQAAAAKREQLRFQAVGPPIEEKDIPF